MMEITIKPNKMIMECKSIIKFLKYVGKGRGGGDCALWNLYEKGHYCCEQERLKPDH
jgi:hypothetical protein